MINNRLSIIGNDDLYNYFVSCARADSLSHAYILLGPKGTGKHSLAHLISAAVNCENKVHENAEIPCLECPSCKKILSNNSADVIYISREKDKATIGIEPIRYIKSDVAVYPNDGDFKTSCLKSTNRSFSAGSGSFHIDFHSAQAMFHCQFGRLFAGHLRCKRCALFGASKAHFAGACPGQSVSLGVGNGNDGVIKRRLNMRHTALNILFDFSLF